ncbi:MAG TPA: 2-amino-4-hydroxy-6-hydroxymethyldihydropteridine diphosphokinase [Terracidiphilus sp.]|nr:2-amino-4-hydroxy-6-hydroxymethyldihydropteridine diphosphokinase [Terracidiphilus sp.]
MGANLPSHAGPPEATLTAAAARLEALGRITERSSLYSTEPVGFADQPRFVNAVIALETDLEPRSLLNALLGIEQEFGRNRSSALPNHPRTLDLDILLLGDIQLREPGLEIPHPRLAERLFVLLPLAEIAPSLVAPGQSKTVSQWLDTLGIQAPLRPEKDRPNRKREKQNHAATPIHWSDWRAGAGGADAGPARKRANADDPDLDRRR